MCTLSPSLKLHFSLSDHPGQPGWQTAQVWDQRYDGPDRRPWYLRDGQWNLEHWCAGQWLWPEYGRGPTAGNTRCLPDPCIPITLFSLFFSFGGGGRGKCLHLVVLMWNSIRGHLFAFGSYKDTAFKYFDSFSIFSFFLNICLLIFFIKHWPYSACYIGWKPDENCIFFLV